MIVQRTGGDGDVCGDGDRDNHGGYGYDGDDCEGGGCDRAGDK